MMGSGIFLTGLNLFLIPFMALLVSGAVFHSGNTLSAWQGWVIAGLGLAAAFLATHSLHLPRRGSWRVGLRALLAAALVAILSAFACSWFLDVSYDGLGYHQLTSLRLMGPSGGDGLPAWNPFREYISPPSGYSHLIQSYPRWQALYAAYFGLITGHLEPGKHFQFLLLFAAWLLTISELQAWPRMTGSRAVTLATLLAFNPVVLCQLFTGMADGPLASGLLIWLTLSARFLRRSSLANGLWVVLSLAGLLNLKSTAPIYVGVILVGGSAALVALGFPWKRRLRPLVSACALGAVLGVAWIGYNPYVENLVRLGSPLYPIRILDTRFDPFYLQTAPDLHDSNRFMKFLRANFSSTKNGYPSPNPELKIPFSLRSDELEYAWMWDTRIGGFGPWYSAALCLALLAMIVGKGRKLETRALWAASAVIAASVFINPECWWARWVPQAWWLACLPLFGVTSPRWIRNALATTLTVNLVLVAGSVISHQLLFSRKAHQELIALTRLPQVQGILDPGIRPGVEHRLRSWGVNYVDHPRELLHCRLWKSWVNGPAEYCCPETGSEAFPECRNMLQVAPPFNR